MYNPNDIEEEIYKFWEKGKYFKNKNILNNNFSIILPPPNITGNLHIGHAFQQTIMDFLIRFNRMSGKNTLWQPGLDHAGIATQLLIERNIKKNNKNYLKNKSDFIKETLKWKNYLSKSIIYQMKRLGNSIYWPNMRFTMDKNSINSVRHAFILLYRDNLIYKNKKIVNWDTKLKSAISDLEISYKKVNNKLWYIKYPIKEENNKKYIIVSTTRPETLLGCVAIAINSKDYNNNHFLGKNAIVPIINRPIPIISSKDIDINYGSGCVQITPANSFNDYEISIKNNLPIINIFSLEGKVNSEAEIIYFINDKKKIKVEKFKLPNYLKNLSINDSKKKIINILKSLNLIHKEENCISNIPYNNRSETKIEPMITDQWYLKVNDLSKEAIKIVDNKIIEFYPQKYKKIYINWMNNIKDWCISRQIWWGHKIPAWNDKYNNLYVGYNIKDVRNYYNISNKIKLYKDKNVLDTWFSSSLWSFISLGWPKKTKKLEYFHPTDLIVSGHDIIFFWISRMIMLTSYIFKKENINNKIPFKKVYITGLINDKYGKKMSKSNGNVINPIDIINNLSKKVIKNKNLTFSKLNKNNTSLGADSLRLTFLSLSTNNKNINFDINKIYGYKNFCNKLWNSNKFILKNCKNLVNNKFYKLNKLDNLILLNKWIVSSLNRTIDISYININNYKFNNFINEIYDFFWNKFCNYYIEMSKLFLLNNDSNDKINNEIKNTLIYVFENIIKLLHPSIPFLTEKIWQLLNNNFEKNLIKNKKKTISLQKFPKCNSKLINLNIEKNFEIIQEIIINIRKEKLKILKKNILKFNINIKIKNNLLFTKIIKDNIKIIKFITKINNISINNSNNYKNFFLKTIINNYIYLYYFL